MVEYKESKNHYAASDSYDLCSIYYYSCVYACYYSFTDYSGLGKASFVGIKNYVAMFHDKLFLIALKNTFLVLLFSVIFLIVGSFMAALLMNKNFHGNAFFKNGDFCSLCNSAYYHRNYLGIYPES